MDFTGMKTLELQTLAAAVIHEIEERKAAHARIEEGRQVRVQDHEHGESKAGNMQRPTHGGFPSAAASPMQAKSKNDFSLRGASEGARRDGVDKPQPAAEESAAGANGPNDICICSRTRKEHIITNSFCNGFQPLDAGVAQERFLIITCETCKAFWSEKRLPNYSYSFYEGDPCKHLNAVGAVFSNEEYKNRSEYDLAFCKSKLLKSKAAYKFIFIRCDTCSEFWTKRILRDGRMDSEPYAGKPCQHVGEIQSRFTNWIVNGVEAYRAELEAESERYHKAKKEFRPHPAQQFDPDAVAYEFLTRAAQSAHAGHVRLFVYPDGQRGVMFARDENGLAFTSSMMLDERLTKRIAAREPAFNPNLRSIDPIQRGNLFDYKAMGREEGPNPGPLKQEGILDRERRLMAERESRRAGENTTPG